MLLQQQKTKNHWHRQAWLDQWVTHNNAPEDHASVLRELHEFRSAGRYADKAFEVDTVTINDLLLTVEEMIDTAQSKVGD
jgi:hypothetical protein